MKLLLCILTLFGTLVGCLSSEHRQLVAVDCLLDEGMTDSAVAMLSTMEIGDIQRSQDSAYYELLTVAAAVETGRGCDDRQLSDRLTLLLSNERLIAYAYHYEALAQYNKGYVFNAICDERIAEDFAKHTGDDRLKYRILTALSLFHFENDNSKTSLTYDYGRLMLTQQVNNPQWVAHTFTRMAANYAVLHKNDSAAYYQKRAQTKQKIMDDEHRALLWTTQGMLSEGKPDQAVQCYRRALQIKSSPRCRILLAQLYESQGYTERAVAEWHQAQNNATLQQQVTIQKALRQYAQQDNNMVLADQLASKIITLNDSLTKLSRHSLAEAAEYKADNDLALMNSVDEQIRLLLIIIAVTMGLISVSLLSFVIVRRSKWHMKKMHERATVMAKNEIKSKKEVKRLTRNISDLHHKHSQIMVDGRRCYEHIKRGDTVVMWDKKDFQNFMEYYRSQDPDFVLHLETDYNRLSVKLQFFETLYRLGYNDESVAKTMGISYNTVRANKSRIRSKSIN